MNRTKANLFIAWSVICSCQHYFDTLLYFFKYLLWMYKYNTIGTITPSCRHFLSFIPNPWLLRTLFSTPQALYPSFILCKTTTKNAALSRRIGKVVASHAAVACSIPLRCTDLHYARGTQGVLPVRVGGATSQFDLLSLTPLSVAGCGWLQLGVPQWAASVHYWK